MWLILLHSRVFQSVFVEIQTGIPDKRDAAAVQQFFMEEVQKGEELLALG